MSMTSADLTTMTREIMNAASSGQWSDATLRTWCGIAQWKLQADLLGANNVFYVNTVTVTQDSSGQFNISSLTTGSTDSTKYFFRILTVAQSTTPTGQWPFYYRQSRLQDFPNPQPNTSLPYIWYRAGSVIQVMPIQAGQALTVQCNYRPPRCDQLSTTSVAVDFPSGYEELIAWWAASTALVKGGSETQAARDIRTTATEMRDNFLEELGRQGTWPIVAQAFDTPQDWSSA